MVVLVGRACRFRRVELVEDRGLRQTQFACTVPATRIDVRGVLAGIEAALQDLEI